RGMGLQDVRVADAIPPGLPPADARSRAVRSEGPVGGRLHAAHRRRNRGQRTSHLRSRSDQAGSRGGGDAASRSAGARPVIVRSAPPGSMRASDGRLALLLIVALAGALRLVRLSTIPNAFDVDEASAGYDAYS